MSRAHPVQNVFRVGLPLLLGAGLALFCGYGFRAPEAAPPAVVLGEILSTVRANYVDELDPERLDQATYEGFDHMLKQLDRHSGFVPPREVEAFEGDTEGYFVGIGVVLSSASNPEEYPEIAAVMPRGPAQEAGIVKGDRIQKVDGTEVRGLEVDQLTRHIVGVENSTVNLAILRGDADSPLEFPVMRRRVSKSSITSVRLYTDESGWKVAGYVRLQQFQSRSAEEISVAIGNLKRAGAPGVVVDLRDNGGGLLRQAVDIAGLFLRSGPIASTKSRREDLSRVYRVEIPGPFTEIPLIFLIDRGSASASELVAAALRDRHRALLIGEESFGKWTVQNVIALGIGGRDGRLKITHKRFYPAHDGRRIRRDPQTGASLGLLPDVKVTTDMGTLRHLRRQWHRESLARVEHPLDVDEMPIPRYEDGDGQPSSDPQSRVVDAPLLRALAILAQPEAYAELMADQKEIDRAAEAASRP